MRFLLAIPMLLVASGVALAQPGPNPHMWPQDKTWPKTGTRFHLAGANISGRLPASSPNTYAFTTTQHYGLTIDAVVRTSPGPQFAMLIEPTYVTASGSILNELGVSNHCRNYLSTFIGPTTAMDRPPELPGRFNTFMRRKDKAVIACLHVAPKTERNVVDVTRKVDVYHTYDYGAQTVTTTTTTTTTIGPVKAKPAAYVFIILYDGNFDSPDFATIAPDLEAIAARIHEYEAGPGAQVTEFSMSYSHITRGDAGAIDGLPTSLNGVALRLDLTSYKGFPWAMAFDMDYLYGKGHYLDIEYSIGLGRYIGPVGFGILVGAGLESLIVRGEDYKNPWFVNVHPEFTAAINAGPRFRVRGWVRPEKFVTNFGGDGRTRAALFQGDGISVFDQFELGGNLVYQVQPRGPSNTGRGSLALFAGAAYRRLWGDNALMFNVGFGVSTGSFKTPPIDPLALPY